MPKIIWEGNKKEWGIPHMNIIAVIKQTDKNDLIQASNDDLYKVQQ